MTVQARSRASDTVPPRPVLSDHAAWRSFSASGWELWVSGFPDVSRSEFARLLGLTDQSANLLKEAASGLPGHGAVLAYRNGMTVGLTDIVASVPLFITGTGGQSCIGSDANKLARTAGLTEHDPHAALQIGLAGYTIGRRTLIKGLRSMKPGEIVVVDASGCSHIRYGQYIGRPDPAIDPDDPQIIKMHNETFMRVIERMVSSAGGRTIMLPLSAGLDSRAVACGLKQAGYEKVICFSYGLSGNHESIGAQRVAAHLGFPWQSIEYSHGRQKAFFSSETAHRFFAFADRPDAMPFMQDVAAIERLRNDGIVPENAIFVNGQSGDYLTGNHIPVALNGDVLTGSDAANLVYTAILKKHFDLWQTLKTPEALALAQLAITTDLAEFGLITDENAFSAFELSEFENRQAKYVVAGQRAYEFFGYEWRLPLWDRQLVEFWRRMPLAAKFQQKLYRTALEEANWGGVWGDDWRFSHTIVPRWIRPLRALTKAASAPFGRERWHRVEKQVFGWIMDPILNYSIVPYSRVLLDRRGFRNALSWHAEAYLERHGISLNEQLEAVT